MLQSPIKQDNVYCSLLVFCFIYSITVKGELITLMLIGL